MISISCEPPTARLDLTRVGLLVKASLASRFVLEVLYCIRQVELAAIDAGAREGLVEEAPGRPDERPPADVLLVTGLLADEHDGRIARPLAENRLRGVAIERTAPAPCASRARSRSARSDAAAASRSAVGVRGPAREPMHLVGAELGTATPDHGEIERWRVGDEPPQGEKGRAPSGSRRTST